MTGLHQVSGIVLHRTVIWLLLEAGLDPELFQRRFGGLPLAGIESSFEIAPSCGRPRIHMFSGVLLLAG